MDQSIVNTTAGAIPRDDANDYHADIVAARQRFIEEASGARLDRDCNRNEICTSL